MEKISHMQAFPVKMSSRRETFVIIVLLVVLAILITWPLVLHFHDSVYGELGDPVSTVWSAKYLRQSGFWSRAGYRTYYYVAYPLGIKPHFPLPLIYMPIALFAYLPRGEALLYNFIILTSLVLNGYCMFILGKRLYGNKIAAIGTGVIYQFCPYALARARYHHTLVGIFIFPLVLYGLLRFMEEPGRKRGLMLFLILLLSMNMHPYYACAVFLMLALLAAWCVARNAWGGVSQLKESFRLLLKAALPLLAAVLTTGTLTYVQLTSFSEGLNAFVRREGDLYTYAAHAWCYIVPSARNAVLGEWVKNYAAARVLPNNVEEYVLFLGYLNVGMAIVAALTRAFRRFSKRARFLTENIIKKASWLPPFSLLMIIVAYLFSLQPIIKIGSWKLRMPSFFVFRIFPFLRVYSRFGVLVFFSVTLMSGACLDIVVNSVNGRKKILIGLAVVLLVSISVFEFYEGVERPLLRLYDIEPIYEKVRELPEDAVIVEYPFAGSDEPANYFYLWRQFHHGRKILNGYQQTTEEDVLRMTVLDLLHPRTPPLLAYMGAEYVVVHKDFYRKGTGYSYLGGEIDLENIPEGLSIIWESGDEALLEVNAERPEMVVRYDRKCSLAAVPEMPVGLWFQFGREWTVTVDSVKDCVVDIGFQIYSPIEDRDLHMDFASGVRVDEWVPHDKPHEVRIHGVKIKRGRNEIRIWTDAEETIYSHAFGGYDMKGVSFAFTLWDVSERNTLTGS